MNEAYHHIPVLLKEAIEFLKPKPGGKYIDCTLGGAGYTIELAKRVGDDGQVLAVDADEMAIENAKKIIQKTEFKNIILSHANFRSLSKIIKENFSGESVKFDGIVFDLGLSSAQLKDQNRGFSFQVDEARLDMAFGMPLPGAVDGGKEKDGESGEGLTTMEIVNQWPKAELVRILKEYGEEGFARRIAEKITEERKKIKKAGGEGIAFVGELVAIIKSAVPAFYRKGRINPATKTFQALRIATNDELGSLLKVLPQAVEALKPGGRLVVISYHSLEDRIVKNFFKSEARRDNGPRIKILTKKVIPPKYEEIKNNPRARSAKLRAAEKL